MTSLDLLEHSFDAEAKVLGEAKTGGLNRFMIRSLSSSPPPVHLSHTVSLSLILMGRWLVILSV